MMNEQDRRQLIAARVREARQLAGLTQGQVAKMLELHRPSVSEIEAGNRRVSAEELAKLANIFDVSLSYLMGEGPEVLAADDPKVQLAARELQKLSPDALDGLLRALAKIRTDEGPVGKTGG
jgi:transcriptional regulator with XRE-family HTH domain